MHSSCNVHYEHDQRPYSVAQLAKRWNCSVSMIRKLIKSNRLRAFRVGELWRIATEEVERYESCQAPQATICTPSSGFAADLHLSGGRSITPDNESVTVVSSHRKIDRAPRRRLAPSGKGLTSPPGRSGASCPPTSSQ